MKRSYVALVCLGLFLAGLALRLPGLGSFLTPDEHLWAGRTAQFLSALHQGNWAATNTSGHPGVTTTWAGSAGLALKWLLNRADGETGVMVLAQRLDQGQLPLDLLPWLRLPVALLCAAGVVLVYLLARRLLGEVVALLGALFLLCDPFYLAHSRLLHLDALVTTAITIAWLALLVATHTGLRRFHVLSGTALGLGILTKSPALVLGPLVVGHVVWAGWRVPGRTRGRLARILRDMLWVGVPAMLVIMAMWPALWVEPLNSIGRVLNLMVTYGQTDHELGNFWLGRPAQEPGPLFYGAVVLWRSSPQVLFGLFLALGWELAALLGRRRAGLRPEDERDEASSGAAGPGAVATTRAAGNAQAAWQGSEGAAALWLPVLWFAVIQSFGDKKFDRYLLPAFPMLDLLAAWGWTQAGQLAMAWLKRHNRLTAPSKAVAWTMAAGLLLAGGQLTAVLPQRPNYLGAYNPLMGGIQTARHTILVGWGEGLEQAAGYLNSHDPEGIGRAAAWYGTAVFAPFYRGQSYDLYFDAPLPADLYARDVDYVVTYISQEQRGLLDPAVRRLLGDPVYSSAEDGVAVAQVYRWPKPFGHTADQPMGTALRLLGWETPRYEPAAQAVKLTLYWDAVGDGSQSVSAWVKDAAGEVWALAEGSPERDRTQAVPAWLDRQATAQAMELALPVGLRAGPYRVEIAVPGGPVQALGRLELPATRVANVRLAALDQAIMPAAVWNGQLQLMGYALKRHDGDMLLDLLWAPGASSTADYQFFLHVTSPAERIVSQVDGPLRQAAGEQGPAWQAGDLVRQRIHVTIPSGAQPGTYRLYVGLYAPPSGPRVPLAVDGRPVADGRYLLTTVTDLP